MGQIKEKIRRANREVFDKIDLYDYELNPSIFDEERQKEIKDVIGRHVAGKKFCADFGCGSGNVLRLLKGYGVSTMGYDIGLGLLKQVNNQFGKSSLVCGDLDYAAFRNEVFDFISFYGVLHHLYKHRSCLREAYRVLKPGGVLYIDHDPNYFLGRVYNMFYRSYFMWRPGFGDEQKEISEWHNTRTGGVNALKLREILFAAGFKSVTVRFRFTTNKDLGRPQKLALHFLKSLASMTGWKSFYTHFYIIAEK